MNTSLLILRRDSLLAALCCLCMLFVATGALAESHSTSLGRGAENALSVPLYKSRVVILDAPATRISVGNPEIADILILRATQLYVLGKDLGTTNVLLWDRNDRLIGTVSVEVTHDLQALKAKLHDLMPNEDISVYSAQRNIVLAGRVSNVSNMNAAIRIAEGYFKKADEKSMQNMEGTTTFMAENAPEDKVGEVINMLSVGGAQQVMLEVRVAEISRTELKRLDVRFNTILRRSSRWNVGGVNGGATFPDVEFDDGLRIPVFNSGADSPFGPIVDNNGAPLGPVIDEFAPNPMSIQDKGFFASLLTENYLFNLAFDAAKEKGLAKILAEPTLTTQTGEQAEFLSGGEFPIPVPRGDRGVTVEFKEFGVGVKFLPLVLDSNRINLKLNISVSELVDSNNLSLLSDGVSQTFLIPRLTKRSAQATVELADGQTIGIAGLINENLRETVTKFPGLGDIPGIGMLFRSQEFQKGETELLILVTPHLAKAMTPGQMRLPTDSFVEPSDSEFFFGGKTEGKSDTTREASLYGHDVN
ncbi:MAG: type II and III secretion system protein family protein [Gammaproteobacteria bacterium]|nr:type II and III secretion system protein family protein [Gammaproteobacteria bacterium]